MKIIIVDNITLNNEYADILVINPNYKCNFVNKNFFDRFVNYQFSKLQYLMLRDEFNPLQEGRI